MPENYKQKIDRRSILNLSLPLAIFLIFGGCCNNVISFETLISSEYHQIKDITSFITFIQILYIFIENFPFLIKNFYKFKVPIKRHLCSTFLFLLGTWLNNFVFRFEGITVPYHIIIKSLNILINMFLGAIILKKRYSIKQILTCIFLTLGCITACIYQKHEFSRSDLHTALYSFHTFLNYDKSVKKADSTKISLDLVLGTSVLISSSVLVALLQIYNNITYEKYGKTTWKEVMIYQHLLSLPCLFLFHAKTIFSNTVYISKNISFNNSFLIKLIINCITQSVCVRGVNLLASNLTKDNFLLLNIVLNSRKLVSLIISCWIFDNSMSLTSYIGCTITFICSFLYSFL